MVWIHGGAFVEGAAAVPLYWGGYLAEQGVVVVSMNYRLGALGFYATTKVSGNWGIKDQQAALQWVQQNIAGFGGNPKDVTLAGQSAGAMSVGCHLTSPSSAGLFHKAILESNPWALPYKTSEEAEDMAWDVARYAGCLPNNLDCLRSLSVDEVLEAQNEGWNINRDMWFDNFVPFGPVVDGTFIPMQPFYALRDGRFNKVPLLTGSVAEDGVMFVYGLFSDALSSTAYKASLDLIFGWRNARTVSDYYPSDMFGNSDDTRDVVSQLGSDLLFLCADNNATLGAVATTGVNAWSYFFTEVWTFEEAWGDFDYCVGRVCHGSELPYIFGEFSDGSMSYYPTSQELELVTITQGYWLSFIKTGNPNGNGLANWPLHASTKTQLELNNPTAYQTNLRKSYCDMWNKIGYFW
jgi:carboxylesterase type B